MGRKLNCETNKYIPKVSQINRHSHKNYGWFHLKQNQTQAGRADRGHGRMDGEDMDTTHYTLCWFLLWLFKASLNSKHVLFFSFAFYTRSWRRSECESNLALDLFLETDLSGIQLQPLADILSMAMCAGRLNLRAENRGLWTRFTTCFFFFLKVCNSWFQPRTTFKFESPEIQNMIRGFREKWALLFWLERW